MKRIWFLIMIMMMAGSVMAQPKKSRLQKTEKTEQQAKKQPSSAMSMLFFNFFTCNCSSCSLGMVSSSGCQHSPSGLMVDIIFSSVISLVCLFDLFLSQLHHHDGSKSGCFRAQTTVSQMDALITFIHTFLHFFKTEVALRTYQHSDLLVFIIFP